MHKDGQSETKKECCSEIKRKTKSELVEIVWQETSDEGHSQGKFYESISVR